MSNNGIAPTLAMSPYGTLRTAHRAPSGSTLSLDSALRRSRPQDLLENSGKDLLRPRAVVLIRSGGNHDNQIELGNDVDRLPAAAIGRRPVEITPVEQRAAEPPEVSVKIESGSVDTRRHRGVDPCLRDDLRVIPATTSEDELTDFRHVAWPQAQPCGWKYRPLAAARPIGISSFDPEALNIGDAQRFEEICVRKSVERLSGGPMDRGGQKHEGARVIVGHAGLLCGTLSLPGKYTVLPRRLQ
jgi:hypothetical protein